MSSRPGAVARIALAAAAYAIDKPYSYAVPAGLTLAPGQRVQVPFGRGNRPTEGIVLSLDDGSTDGLKPVTAALEDTPGLTPLQLKLAAFIRDRYFCTFYDAARVMLPAGLWFRSRNTYRLTEDTSWQGKTLRKQTAAQVLETVASLGGCATDEKLSKLFTAAALDEAIPYLLRKKWLSASASYTRKLGDKRESVVTLAVSGEEVQSFCARSAATNLQRSVLELLSKVGSAAVKDVCYYTGASSAVIKRLEKNGQVRLSDREVLRCREIHAEKIESLPVLTEEQSRAFEGLKNQMQEDAPKPALLFGVTGSGKTSVYINLISECLRLGRTAILLVPEIALTPQLLKLMVGYFGEDVAVLHSSLSASERLDQWKRVKKGRSRVVVGTRSAVFAPVENLGLLILDEEQESSYRSEASPRYCAREVALWRGVHEKALVLLASATPSVVSMYRAKTGVYSLFTLQNRYNQRALPKVEIVDMREELKSGNDLSLSLSLRRQMLETKNAGNQTVLLLNRRGNSRALVCVDCRESPDCPRCSAHMTYHSANNRLMCHYCGHSVPAPVRCPKCGGPLKAIGTGTQKVEQEIKSVFPDFSVTRMDTDTVSTVNTHERILSRFSEDAQDVLLGTQMVAKGLNFPKVTLVGVLDADLGLYSGSYMAAETTFDMLTQVVGRAGRGQTEGRAVIQTMVPNHQIMELAAKQDYMGFYRMELEVRRVLNAPPFADRASVIFIGQEETAVLRSAVKFRDSLVSFLQEKTYARESCQVLGPAPCVVPKINYQFRYQLTLTGKFSKTLRSLLSYLLCQSGKDPQNRNITVYMDTNGYE